MVDLFVSNVMSMLWCAHTTPTNLVLTFQSLLLADQILLSGCQTLNNSKKMEASPTMLGIYIG
jgi:hypothetical protein